MSDITFHTEQRKIGELVPASYNPRKLTDEQYKQIKKSLEKFNLAEIPAINKDNTILAGHQRMKILAEIKGADFVIDVRVPNRLLNEEECKEYNIRSNKNTGEWDFDVLANEFDLDMLQDIGFTELELGLDSIYGADENDDDVPLFEGNPISKFGDLYEFGGHRVLCGDVNETGTIEKLMESNRANMVFTDPPYNINYQGIVGTKRNKILNDKMESKVFYDFLHTFIINVMPYIQGAFYICMTSGELHNLWKAFTDGGGHWQDYILWVKDSLTMSRKDYHQQYEPVMYGLSENMAQEVEDHYEKDCDTILYGWNKHQFYGGRKQPNVWFFDRPKRSKEHPTMKPVALCQKAIVNSSQKDEIVLDPFLGSGSTLIACQRTGRRCYGIEIEPHYVDVIINRWCVFTGNKKVVRNGVEIEWDISS